MGGSAAAIVIVIAAVSGWCLWRNTKKPPEEPRELEVWQVGTTTSEPRNEPENYYATMRPGTWIASNQSNALEDSDYIYENEIYTTMPPVARAVASQPESEYEGTYIYAN